MRRGVRGVECGVPARIAPRKPFSSRAARRAPPPAAARGCGARAAGWGLEHSWEGK